MSVGAGLSRPPYEMLLACACFSVMATFVFAVGRLEPSTSSFVASFVRTIVNMAALLGVLGLSGSLGKIWGDKRSSLWLRGLFGAAALMLLFAGIRAIGLGEASFLSASNGIFIAALGPFLLGQKSSRLMWLAILGGMVGLFLLFQPRFEDVAPVGRVYSIVSGLLVALAYLMVAQAGKTNAPSTVIFYFCLMSAVLHVAYLVVLPVTWPAMPVSWAMLVIAAVFGTVGQYFVTVAYQRSPAALNAAVSYALPVMNLLMGALVFRIYPDGQAWAGAAIVVVCGVILPFLRR